MSSWQPISRLKKGLAPVGASVTDTPISDNFPITAGGSKHLVVAVEASAVTSTTGITAKLQTSIDGGTTWSDSKTAAIATTGWAFIKLLAEASSDQTYLPLLPVGRVVVTTGTGDAVTVSDVRVVQDI